MIIIQLSDSLPYVEEGMAVKKLGESLPEIPEVLETEFCPFVFGGTFRFCVYAHEDATDWRNDKSEFMFKRFIPNDSVDMELWLDGAKIADLNNNSYGTYFPTFSGTSSQSLQKGYLVNWYDVYMAHGFGMFQIKANLNIVGNQSVWESDPYDLVMFTEERADRSVSIISEQDGNIMSSVFDYTGLEWHQQIRLKGTFYEEGETFEKNAYRTQNYKQKQIQDEIVENWALELDLLPRNISEFLTKDRLLSNSFNVSDYSLMNEKIHKLKGVYPESIEKTKIESLRNSNYLIKFTSKVKNIIKRNY